MSNETTRQLQTTVYRYCLSITGSNWDAEDLVQDTWVKAWSMLKENNHANPEALMMRIAKNTWIDRTRRNKVFTRIIQQEAPLAWTDNSWVELETAFQSLVNHLSPLQRTVFLLRDVMGYSIEETATMLKTSAGAIKAALHRARHSLEAVRIDLNSGELASPEDEGMKAYVRALASAYQSGDIAALAALALNDVWPPAAVAGMMLGRVVHAAAPQQPVIRMAA